MTDETTMYEPRHRPGCTGGWVTWGGLEVHDDGAISYWVTCHRCGATTKIVERPTDDDWVRLATTPKTTG